MSECECNSYAGPGDCNYIWEHDCCCYDFGCDECLAHESNNTEVCDTCSHEYIDKCMHCAYTFTCIKCHVVYKGNKNYCNFTLSQVKKYEPDDRTCKSCTCGPPKPDCEVCNDIGFCLSCHYD